jgi:proteasome lid subunit RPN8/RPN11
MLHLPRAIRDRIAALAEAAYPGECCGLLVGFVEGDGAVYVHRMEPSPNVAEGDKRDRFEVDPKLRFELMRELGDGFDQIVGHYHSHPDHPPEPSAHDLAMAFEPDLVWVIQEVRGGRAGRLAAHRLERPQTAEPRFEECPIAIEESP